MSDSRNPNIKEDNKATRFGEPGGPDPRAAQAMRKSDAWSVRRSIRFLARQEVDPEQDASEAYKFNQKTVTRAQRIAMKTLRKADEGDSRAIDQVIDNIDGKLVQPTMNADMAMIQGMTDEQLEEFVNSFNTAASANGGNTGDTEATGSGSVNAEARSQLPAPDSTGSI